MNPMQSPNTGVGGSAHGNRDRSESDISIDEILTLLRNVKTMPDLDSLRISTVNAMTSGDENTFNKVQTAFRKAKNRLKRIPLKDRAW